MKIYKSDGSCIDNPADTEFGWNLNEENVLFHNKFCKTPNKEVKLWENPIQTAQISSVVDFELASGLDEIAETPQKSQICSLINPCTVESKVLLSVVHNAMYRNFDRRMLNLEHFKNGTRLPLCQDIESVIFNQIQDFSRDENNVLSLMMDLILTENRCDRHELCDNLQFQNRDFVDRIQHKHFCERVREKCLSYSEFEDVINRIVQEISDRTVDLDLEIDKIKKSFEDEKFCLNILTYKAHKLEKNLRETKFLDDLIHLLNGDLEKVSFRDSPFRIFLQPDKCEEINLII